jgi:hypothetical protein
MGRGNGDQKFQGGGSGVKNLMVANYRPHGRITEIDLRKLVIAQIENSLDVGWAASDIVVMANFELEVSVTLVRAPLNESCLTGSKMFGLRRLFEQGMIDGPDVWWTHDLDAWQNDWFDPPELADIGLAEYSTPKFNGGSVFLRSAARDLVSAIVSRIEERNEQREEPAINTILRSVKYKHRVTTVNSTYNVGCSGYAPRYLRSLKPVRVSHFHPTGGASWRTHVDGVNPVGIGSVSPRLLKFLVERFHGGVRPTAALGRGGPQASLSAFAQK